MSLSVAAVWLRKWPRIELHMEAKLGGGCLEVVMVHMRLW